MEYAEDLIADLLKEWKSKGYTDTIIIDHGLLFAINQGKYFSLGTMKEDFRANIYDENLSGSAWSMHAISLDDTGAWPPQVALVDITQVILLPLANSGF